MGGESASFCLRQVVSRLALPVCLSRATNVLQGRSGGCESETSTVEENGGCEGETSTLERNGGSGIETSTLERNGGSGSETSSLERNGGSEGETSTLERSGGSECETSTFKTVGVLCVETESQVKTSKQPTLGVFLIIHAPPQFNDSHSIIFSAPRAGRGYIRTPNRSPDSPRQSRHPTSRPHWVASRKSFLVSR